MLDQIVNLVIRPPRAEYAVQTDLVGPLFALRGRQYRRHDLQLVNNRGHVLECSHYLPAHIPPNQKLPCVIYCHGNSGCRADASEAVFVLLPSNITVFALDFSGSGMSQGDYVTLGRFEMEDLTTVVDHLRVEGSVSLIGLWGRSMGAVTSLMYAAKDLSIAGMVLDSPFSNLPNLILELVDTFKIKLPKFTVKMLVYYLRNLIKKKVPDFDINDLDAVAVAKTSFIPVLFGHASGDTFILPHHSQQIHEAYAGDKNLITFAGDHNSHRPNFFYDSASIFFHNVLQPPPIEDEPPALYSHIPGSLPLGFDRSREGPAGAAAAGGGGGGGAAAAAVSAAVPAGAVSREGSGTAAAPSMADLNHRHTSYQRPPPVAQPADGLLSSEDLARLMAEFGASVPAGEESTHGLEDDFDEDEMLQQAIALSLLDLQEHEGGGSGTNMAGEGVSR
ncbi:hypothetical protein CLOP_g24356 [Closterium sp. NIES-67]|nr:hypothetical protein CLOP_g24356 [Closterium sp. NIES-67]